MLLSVNIMYNHADQSMSVTSQVDLDFSLSIVFFHRYKGPIWAHHDRITISDMGLPPNKNAHFYVYFSYCSTETYVVGAQKDRLNETVLLSTHKLHFC